MQDVGSSIHICAKCRDVIVCHCEPPYKEIAQDYERRLYYFWDENERLRAAIKEALPALRLAEMELAGRK